MPRDKRKPSQSGRGASSETARTPGVEGRAQSLLLRLETDGVHLLQAAEELDRLQAALERAGKQEDVRERLDDLCMAWAELPLRGDRADAWLTLVGALDLKEHAPRVAEIVANAGLPAPLRIRALRTLPRVGGEDAVPTLHAVLVAKGDPQVRAAAAEALAELRHRPSRPVLEALLEEDLPRNVYTAAGAALDRLR